MTADGAPRISTGIVAAVLLLVAVYYGSDVLAPLALAFLVIAIVWPLQQRLQSRLPALVALATGVVGAFVVLSAPLASAEKLTLACTFESGNSGTEQDVNQVIFDTERPRVDLRVAQTIDQ